MVVKRTPAFLASSSNTIKPTLCRVSAYSGPMFPNPTMRYFMNNKYKKRVHLAGIKKAPRFGGAFFFNEVNIIYQLLVLLVSMHETLLQKRWYHRRCWLLGIYRSLNRQHVQIFLVLILPYLLQRIVAYL